MPQTKQPLQLALKEEEEPGMVAHAFDPSTWETKAGGSRLAWSTEGVPDQLGPQGDPVLKQRSKH